MWRSASLLVPTLLTSTLLGLAVCSAPMVSSAAATAALRQDLDEGCPFDVGLRAAGLLAAQDDLAAKMRSVSDNLDRALRPQPGLLPSVATVFGGIADVKVGEKGAFVQLISRSDAQRWITILDQIPGDGIWLADETAAPIGAVAGSTVNLNPVGRPALALVVKGIFRNPAREKRPWFWCSMSATFEASGSEDRPPIALVTQDTMLALFQGMPAELRMSWEVAPARGKWTESTAIASYGVLNTVADSVMRKDISIAIGTDADRPTIDQQGSLAHARRAKQGTLAVLLPVALGAALVCFLLFLLAIEAWRARRAQILVVLVQRGFGPGALSAMAVAEFITPLALGLAMGWLVAVQLVPEIGPSAVVDAAVVRSSALLALALGIGTAALLFALIYFEVRRGVVTVTEKSRRRLPWQQVCVALAGAAGYEMRSRAGSSSGARVDSLVTAFPVLLLAGAAGLLTRMVVAMVARLQQRVMTRPRRAWLSLAAGRLTANRSRTIPTITALAVSSGVVLFTASLAGSVGATSIAKSTLGLGSAQVAVLDTNTQLVAVQQARLKDTTPVLRATEPTVLVTAKPPIDILAVDPTTFAGGAFWEPEFSTAALPALLRDLQGPPLRDGSLAVVAVGGGLPNNFAMELPTATGAVPVTVTVVGRARYFPGLGLDSNRPLVVFALAPLLDRNVVGRPEIWTNQPAIDLKSLVSASGTAPQRIIRASVRRNVDVSYQVDALRSARAIGAFAVVASVAAIWLYFAGFGDHRRRDRAIAKMLGLTRQADIAANLAEVVPLIVSGVLLATGLSWISLRLAVGSLDANVATPPSPLFRFAYATAAAFAASALLTAVVLALVLARATVRTDIVEVLRDAD